MRRIVKTSMVRPYAEGLDRTGRAWLRHRLISSAGCLNGRGRWLGTSRPVGLGVPSWNTGVPARSGCAAPGTEVPGAARHEAVRPGVDREGTTTARGSLLQRPGRGVPERTRLRRVVLGTLDGAAVRDEGRLLVQRDGGHLVPQQGVDLVAQLTLLGRVRLLQRLVDQRINRRRADPRIVLPERVRTLRRDVRGHQCRDERAADPGEER